MLVPAVVAPGAVLLTPGAGAVGAGAFAAVPAVGVVPVPGLVPAAATAPGLGVITRSPAGLLPAPAPATFNVSLLLGRTLGAGAGAPPIGAVTGVAEPTWRTGVAGTGGGDAGGTVEVVGGGTTAVDSLLMTVPSGLKVVVRTFLGSFAEGVASATLAPPAGTP